MKIIMPANYDPDFSDEPIQVFQKIRVACYIRVSTNDPSQEDSYEAQEKYFSKLLFSRPDWESMGVYSDYGISGTGKENRTGLNRLLRHCEQGKIDRVICKSISRLSRNTANTIAIIRQLKSLGITCYFEKEGLDTGDMDSEFILTTLAALAQEESHTISQNLRWSFDKRAPKGDLPNYACYGYRLSDETEVTDTGYKRRKVEIIPEEAEVVKEIFRLYADGLSMTDIVHVLNHKKIPAPWSDCGWMIGRIRYILRNERYCGDVLTHKKYTENYLTHRSRRNNGEVTQFYIQGHHPAIITQELFQKVQSLFRKSTHAREQKEYPYTGRLVCAHCGKHYHFIHANGDMTWQCSSARINNGMRLCDAEKISQVNLDLMFLDAVKIRFPKYQKLLAQLEATQDLDFVERDRSILRRHISIIEDEMDASKKICEELQSQIEVLIMRYEVFDEEYDETEIMKKIHVQEKMISQLEAEKQEIRSELEKKEKRWELLEKDYDIRSELIHLMKTEDKDQVLSNLHHYVKALVLFITVHDTEHYTVHWFDGTKTEILKER